MINQKLIGNSLLLQNDRRNILCRTHLCFSKLTTYGQRGLLLPQKWATNVSIKLGNQIIGPGDADPDFGGHGSYYDWNRWHYTGERIRTGVKSSDYWWGFPKW